MEEKKRVVILVTIALVLAVTAIALNLMDSGEEMATSINNPSVSESQPGQVGVEIASPKVEDKLAQESG